LIPQKPINGIPRPPVPYEIRIMSGSAAIRYSKDTLMALSVSTDTNSVIELPASLLADAKLEKVQPNSRGFGILKFGDGNQANLFWSSKLNNKDEVVGIPAPQNQNIVFRIVDDAGRVPPIDVPVEFNLDKGGFTSGGDQKLKDAAEKLTMRSRDKQSEPPAPPPRPPVRNGKGM